MAKDAPVVPLNMKVSKLAEAITRGDPWLTHHHAVVIVNHTGDLAGIITRGDIVRALQNDPTGNVTVWMQKSCDNLS